MENWLVLAWLAAAEDYWFCCLNAQLSIGTTPLDLALHSGLPFVTTLDMGEVGNLTPGEW